MNPRVSKCIKQHFASHTPYPQLSSEVISKLTKASAKTTTVIALNKVPSPCLVADTLQKISSHMLDKKQPEAQKSGSCHANATPESSKSPKDVEAACQLNISDNNLPMSCLPRIIEQLQSFPFKIAGFDASGNHKLGNNGVRDLLECNMSNAIKQIELVTLDWSAPAQSLWPALRNVCILPAWICPTILLSTQQEFCIFCSSFPTPTFQRCICATAAWVMMLAALLLPSGDSKGFFVLTFPTTKVSVRMI